MDLLPRSSSDFGKQQFWDDFYKKRGKRAFEWYGEYSQLSDHLKKCLKSTTKILIVGCGNSTLGNDLYDDGYKNVTSIDLAKDAIRQMKAANEKLRPGMKFVRMNATAMTFADESFGAIIDKGTLDALMTDSEPETLQKVDKYFDEMLRVMPFLGRYVCVSLLQNRVLEVILNKFPAHNCVVKIARCVEAEKASFSERHYPVFVVICMKMNSLSRHVFELSLTPNGITKVEDAREVMREIEAVQFKGQLLASLPTNEHCTFNLHRKGEAIPRYTAIVVDIKKKGNKPYGVFIVPYGREKDWIFSSESGQKQLAAMSHCNRLLLVVLNRHQMYTSAEAIQKEVEPYAKELMPSTAESGYKIPFMAVNNDSDNSKRRYAGHSQSSGDYIVDDVLVDNQQFRRLYYLSCPITIQSEAKVVGVEQSDEKAQLDLTYITCDYHFYISAALKMQKCTSWKTLIIGLGGGGLCSFLRKFVPDMHITAVEIDPDMLEIATKWFDLQLDDRLKVEIVDGLDFLKTSEALYDNIVFDVDCKDPSIGISCPPLDFLTDATLQDVNRCLVDEGLFVLNLVLRNNELRPRIVETLKRHFTIVASHHLKEDLNEIFFCSTRAEQQDDFLGEFANGMQEVNIFLLKSQHEILTRKPDIPLEFH